MFCYIKEWRNKMATLMTADGVVLCTFNSTDEALQVWHTWHQHQKKQTQSPNPPPAHSKIDVPEANLQIIPYATTFSNWLANR